MTEKRTKATTTTARKAAPRKTAAKKAVKAVELTWANAGSKAGDVYQALAAAQGPLTVAEIAKNENISEDEVLVGLGWLFKEGKIKDEDGKVTLA